MDKAGVGDDVLGFDAVGGAETFVGELDGVLFGELDGVLLGELDGVLLSELMMLLV